MGCKSHQGQTYKPLILRCGTCNMHGRTRGLTPSILTLPSRNKGMSILWGWTLFNQRLDNGTKFVPAMLAKKTSELNMALPDYLACRLSPTVSNWSALVGMQGRAGEPH